MAIRSIIKVKCTLYLIEELINKSDVPECAHVYFDFQDEFTVHSAGPTGVPGKSSGDPSSHM